MPAVDIDSVVASSMDIFCCTPPSLTWRQHDSPDCHSPSEGLGMESLSISVLKEERVGH